MVRSSPAHVERPSELPPRRMSKAPTALRRKTKTFTGCWTCRARRVKCDEAHPFCNRCTHSRLACEGYGVRLAWKEGHGKGSGSTGPFRKLIELESNVGQISLDHMNNMLRHCSTATASQDTKSFGPFSVFSILSRPPEQTVSLDLLDPQRCPGGPELESQTDFGDVFSPAFIATSSSMEQSDGQGTPGPSSYTSLSDYLEQPNLDFNTSTDIPANELPMLDLLPMTVSTVDDQDSIQILPQLPDSRNIIWDDPLQEGELIIGLDSPGHTSESTRFSSFGDPVLPCRYLNTLSDLSHTEHGLIHHWLVFMCKNMVPVNTIDNPYRVLYLRLASEALTSFSSSKLAVFHGLCAAAAESLNTLRDHKNDDSNLSLTKHANAALKSLQELIASPTPKDYTSILAAIIMCILRDSVMGQPGNWRLHTQAALKIVNEALASGVEAASSLHILAEQCVCIAAFGNLESEYDLGVLVAQLPDTEHYLYNQHSVTKSLLGFVTLINAISKTGLEANPVTLDGLELRIYLQAAPIVHLDKSGQKGDAIIIQHYHHVYYYALLIFFQRLGRHRPPSQFQDLVHEGLVHLEAAEDIAMESNGCILLWPCMTIASECVKEDLKTRALKWFERKKRHGFNNVNTATKICRGYWRWRDENAVACLSKSWQDFVVGTEYDVVPV
ncbi:uncharacterized protein E0L32_007458 [Thyridium curvatum]|uniref:Zn(2)-C6 fungal-type domain-containing protein n=1 Tax=Thyridium curvatum TaxID=1093900 RepID=A0A507B3U7_9PEZI|nr:uncharacterized protein E0L32_007458 [Thyridium curvatum]TPX11721.1 hypothetical protein E0L32_007458 [Thyridium curvatum]